jgi:hypothetical protein
MKSGVLNLKTNNIFLQIGMNGWMNEWLDG